MVNAFWNGTRPSLQTQYADRLRCGDWQNYQRFNDPSVLPVLLPGVLLSDYISQMEACGNLPYKFFFCVLLRARECGLGRVSHSPLSTATAVFRHAALTVTRCSWLQPP